MAVKAGTIPEPIKVRGGHVLKFSRFSLEVETRYWFQKSDVRSFFWDTIGKIDVLAECFSGAIIVSVVGGGRLTLHCSARQVMRVASILYHFTNTSRAARQPCRSASASDDVTLQLQKHPKVGICDDGILLKKRLDMCASHVKFVPWNALVSVSLSASGKCVTATVALLQEDQRPDTNETSLGGGPSAEAPAAPTLEVPEPDGSPSEPAAKAKEPDSQLEEKQEKNPPEVLGTITIIGNKALSKLLFDEMVRRMTDGRTETAISEVKTKGVVVQLSEAGVFSLRSRGCFGGQEKYFLPWESIAALKWAPRGLLSKSRLSAMTLSGQRLDIVGATLPDFKHFCETFQKNLSEVGMQPSAPAVAQRGLSLSNDGIHLASSTTWGGPCQCMQPEGQLHSFVPWARVDIFEIRIGRMPGLGGRVNVITEGGERVTVARSWVTTSRLWEVYGHVHTLKYGASEAPPIAVFNQQGKAQFNSELNLKSIKVFAKGTMREYDLERIVECTVGLDNNRLLLKVLTGVCRHEDVQIQIKNATTATGVPLSPAELAIRICTAAAARRKDIELHHQAAVAGRSSGSDEVALPAAPRLDLKPMPSLPSTPAPALPPSNGPAEAETEGEKARMTRMRTALLAPDAGADAGADAEAEPQKMTHMQSAAATTTAAAEAEAAADAEVETQKMTHLPSALIATTAGADARADAAEAGADTEAEAQEMTRMSSAVIATTAGAEAGADAEETIGGEEEAIGDEHVAPMRSSLLGPADARAKREAQEGVTEPRSRVSFSGQEVKEVNDA